MKQHRNLISVMESETIQKNGASPKSQMSRGNILKLYFALFVVSVMFCGCSHRVLDFTLVSTKNVDLSKASSFKRGATRISGKDMAHWIIIFPTKSVDIKEAIDKAIQSTPGCVALLDGVIYTTFWLIPYIYGQQAAIIEGTPLIDPSILAENPTNEMPTYGKVELDKKGKIKNVESITADEYIAMKCKIIKDTKKAIFNHSSEI